MKQSKKIDGFIKAKYIINGIIAILIIKLIGFCNKIYFRFK